MASHAMSSGVASWLTLALFCCLLSIFLVLLVRRRRFVNALKNVPSPPALPILGNAYQLNCDPEELFRKFLQWGKEFNDIYLLWVGLRPFIFLYKVEAVQPLLNSGVHIDKSLEYKFLKPWLGTGLITSTGDKWHFRRKLLTPTFHSGLLDDYMKIVIREARVMITCLEKEVGKEFDIVPYAKRAALDVICDSTMGYHMNLQTNYRNEYVEAVEKISSISQKRFTNIWIAYDPIFKLTALGKEHDHSLRIIQSFIDKVITDRKNEWSRKRDGNFNEPTKKRQALLDLLLELSQDGKILSEQDIREEVNTFMYAGHDTMATSIAWILYALGRNPQYQTKIIDEYNSVDEGNEITIGLLNKLVWLDACIKEAWRLYPVVPLIARQIYNPINLLGHDVPPGSTVLINSVLLHRDARHFAEPDVYRPERFLPGSPKIPNFAFIPFSAGSRNCIGYKFATNAIKTIILMLLTAFRVEALDREDQLRFVSELVLVNAGGLRLKIVPRER